MRISEIYVSIQGESQYAGLPCTFIRTTGCDLRCRYCDSTYAFHGGRTMEVEAILNEVQSFGVPMVLLTGGEPMLQPDLPRLATRLLENKFRVSIETSGAHALDSLPEEVIRIVDVKTPYSGEAGRMHPAVLQNLKAKDAIKFVLADESDYQWAKEQLPQCLFSNGPEVLFSPVHGMLDPKMLIEWILRDRLTVRVNLQLHKYIWGADTRGV